MGQPSFLQRYITWPIQSHWQDFRLRVFNDVLRENGMDWGKYPLEEVYKMYHRHKYEIVKD
jgi:hypothetical protein